MRRNTLMMKFAWSMMVILMASQSAAGRQSATLPPPAESPDPKSVQKSVKPQPAQDRPVDSDDNERHPSRWKRKLKAKYA